MDAGKSLEEDVKQIMEHATGRDPLMLRTNTGLGRRGATPMEEIDLIFSMIGGVETAVLRIAREIDESRMP